MHAIDRPTQTGGCTAEQKEAVLDELRIMMDGLWPSEENGLIERAAEDLDRAKTMAELRGSFSLWANHLNVMAQDPDDEARMVLAPAFARDAGEHVAAPVPWGRICWSLPW